MDCDLVTQLTLLSCGYGYMMILYPNCIDGKTLMMDYEGDLVSLVIPIIFFNYS